MSPRSSAPPRSWARPAGRSASIWFRLSKGLCGLVVAAAYYVFPQFLIPPLGQFLMSPAGQIRMSFDDLLFYLAWIQEP